MLKSSGRRIDISWPVVDAIAPDGHGLHVRARGHQPGVSAVYIRQFVLKAARVSDLVELASLTSSAAAILVASGRAGHEPARRRLDPGRQPQPALTHPAARSGAVSRVTGGEIISGAGRAACREQKLKEGSAEREILAEAKGSSQRC